MNWKYPTYPQQLQKLEEYYDAELAGGVKLSDQKLLDLVEATLWPTSCWCYVEASFAIIAPACARRPHLAKPLLRHPICAMIAGGVLDAAEVIPNGVALATKTDPYVMPTDEGKLWLMNELPKLESVVYDVFSTAYSEM